MFDSKFVQVLHRMELTLSNFRDVSHCEAMLQMLKDFSEDPSLNGIAPDKISALRDKVVARITQLEKT
jgi:hypothetical protein